MPKHACVTTIIVLLPFLATMSGKPVWSLSARLRNKRMHALNGNSATPPANLRPGYQQPQHSWLHVATLNVRGFHNSAKWLAVQCLPYDILLLSETQVQTHFHSTLHHKLSNYHLQLSPGKPEKHYTGVALCATRTKFWATHSITWPVDHPCYPFWQENQSFHLRPDLAQCQ